MLRVVRFEQKWGEKRAPSVEFEPERMEWKKKSVRLSFPWRHRMYKVKINIIRSLHPIAVLDASLLKKAYPETFGWPGIFPSKKTQSLRVKNWHQRKNSIFRKYLKKLNLIIGRKLTNFHKKQRIRTSKDTKKRIRVIYISQALEPRTILQHFPPDCSNASTTFWVETIWQFRPWGILRKLNQYYSELSCWTKVIAKAL